MSDVNTVNLINQMRTMANEASGSSVEFGGKGVDSFNNVFRSVMTQINDLTQNADALKTRFELGDPNVSLGEVMIASQKSNLGFEAALRVRNRVVQAYQDIMNMPV
ncbi:MAG: flagellar hook-basal body complex protein FliE [Legionella sp.]|nr:MAG: flagellar hook-basal body complex protein FliE [Legionella sp.]